MMEHGSRFVSALVASVAVSVLHAATALAQDSAYCRKVRAHAAGDAALLMAPRLLVEGIRFPSSHRLDLGPTVGNNYQARIGAAYSPIDLYRGLRLSSLSEADCEHHDIAENIAESLTDAVESGRLPAHRQQAAYLNAHRDEWVALLDKAEERLKAGAITAVEFHELRRFTQVLERKAESARGEAERIEARGAKRESLDLRNLAEQYTAHAARLDREVSRLRSLDPWSLKLSGGVIPLPDQPLDWFAMIEVSYNLGGLIHGHQEDRALVAGGDEVRQARYELPARLNDVATQIRTEIDRARRELTVVKTELSFLRKTRATLDGTDAPNVEHARATLAIEQFSIESDVVFLQTLVESLSSLVKVPHDS
jgi:hypothetical protein